MKKKFLTAVFILTAAFVFNGCAKSEPGSPADTNTKDTAQPQEGKPASGSASLVKNLTFENTTAMTIDYNIDTYTSIQNFSYTLFQKNADEENPVLSPVSAYLALAMANAGADGNTQKEFLSLLGEDVTAMSDYLMNQLPKNSENTAISLANSAWIDDGFTVDERWVGAIKSFMDAETYQCDLPSTQAMDSMNEWIDKNTNSLIKQMLEKPLDGNARLALFNTVYFKAKWAVPFEKMSTREDAFTLEGGESIQAEMMHNYRVNMDYLENSFAEGLIFPYRNWEEGDGNFAFVAVKPKSADKAIRDVYGELIKEDNLGKLLSEKQTKLVNTMLPRFEITYDKTLNESLKPMDAFDWEKADFSRMGTTKSGENLYISLVRQKAKVIVDEEGTEAAAATEVIMEERECLDAEEPQNVFFNEPFIYIIMDMDEEIPLFIGILDNPVV